MQSSYNFIILRYGRYIEKLSRIPVIITPTGYIDQANFRFLEFRHYF